MAEAQGVISLAACLAQVLASPTRIKLLKLVQADELCVCELSSLLAISQPGVSQHLNKLRQAGLVTERKDGTTSFFRAADVSLRLREQVLSVFDANPASMAEMAPYLARLADARPLRGAGGVSPRKC